MLCLACHTERVCLHLERIRLSPRTRFEGMGIRTLPYGARSVEKNAFGTVEHEKRVTSETRYVECGKALLRPFQQQQFRIERGMRIIQIFLPAEQLA